MGSASSEEPAFVLATEQQVRAFAHPLRQRIVDLLARNELTNKQIADALEKPPGNIHHHVVTLERAGLIQQTRSRQYRGVVERYYKASAQRFALASTPGGHSQTVTVAALQAASGRLADEAVEDGTGIVRILSETRWLTDSDLQRLDKLIAELRHLMMKSGPVDPGAGRRVAVITIAQELVADATGEALCGADDE